jgi:hypothetical protein
LDLHPEECLLVADPGFRLLTEEALMPGFSVRVRELIR